MHMFGFVLISVVVATAALPATVTAQELNFRFRFPTIEDPGNRIKLDFRPYPTFQRDRWRLDLDFRLDFVPATSPTLFLAGSSRFDAGKLSLRELARGLRFTAESSNYSAFRMEGWRITEKGAEIWIKIGG